ncbi:hypothetical protein [uncultured Amaricoccus sp.]|uniref:hypothetical protein n=1 Tax=uncultured Amaricoccus sp. TaxID=339341 RepID=UPI00262C7F24|nr:hypothetical protein [uncultured Amaricoccus sp.]
MDSGILGILIAMALLAAAVFFLVGALVRWSRRLAWRGLAALGLAFVAAIGGVALSPDFAARRLEVSAGRAAAAAAPSAPAPPLGTGPAVELAAEPATPIVAPPPIRRPPGFAEATCRADLSCWGEEHARAAREQCPGEIERLAKYSARWTDGWLGVKFSHYRWSDKAAGVIAYLGDEIEFQNGFGAFQRHVYTCVYDPDADSVLEVQARPGRL